MLLDYNTFGPPTPAQAAAHVAALAFVANAGFTPFPAVSFVADGQVHASSVETAPHTHGHPAFCVSALIDQVKHA